MASSGLFATGKDKEIMDLRAEVESLKDIIMTYIQGTQLRMKEQNDRIGELQEKLKQAEESLSYKTVYPWSPPKTEATMDAAHQQVQFEPMDTGRDFKLT